jgi:hypothetical protein
MGAVEEGGKAVTTLFQTMRTQPLALAMGLMNIALLVFLFYYLSRITTRTETTATALFEAQDKLYTQWSSIIKDTHAMVERSNHCIAPEDALKLISAGVTNYGLSPLNAAPEAAPK